MVLNIYLYSDIFLLFKSDKTYSVWLQRILLYSPCPKKISIFVKQLWFCHDHVQTMPHDFFRLIMTFFCDRSSSGRERSHDSSS